VHTRQSLLVTELRMAALALQYAMLIGLIAVLLGIPPLRWVYRTYVTLFVKAAQEQVPLLNTCSVLVMIVDIG
jgi:hypothetical protein